MRVDGSWKVRLVQLGSKEAGISAGLERGRREDGGAAEFDKRTVRKGEES